MPHFRTDAIGILVVTTWAAVTLSTYAQQKPTECDLYYPKDGPPPRFVVTWPGRFCSTEDLTIPTHEFYRAFEFYPICTPYTPEKGAIRVAQYTGESRGWIPVEDGFTWTTRQGVDVRLKKENAAPDFPLPVFREMKELEEFLGNDPNAPEPFAIVRQCGPVWMKSPILDHGDVYVNGQCIKALKVKVVIGADAAEGEGPAVEPKPIEEWLEQLFRVDICFVQDTTQSMAKYKDTFRTEIVALLSQLLGRYKHLDLKVGWSVYQDIDCVKRDGEYRECEPAEFLGEFSINNKDQSQKDSFDRTIKETEWLEAPWGTFGRRETVFAGMAKALDKFGWREGALRILVVCGDAPNHEPESERNVDGHTIKSIVDSLDKKKVVPFAIFVTTRDLGSVLGQQMEEIAAGVKEKGGRAFPIEDAKVQFRGALTDLLVKTVSGVVRRAGELGIYRSGRSRTFEVSDKQAFSKEPERTVRTWVKTEGPESHYSPWDIRVYEAWIPQSIPGEDAPDPVTETYVLVSDGELQLLQIYLLDLMDLRRADAAELIAAGRYAEVFGHQNVLTTWLDKVEREKDWEHGLLSDYLKLRHHVHARTDLFHLTGKDFASLTDEQRIEIVAMANKYRGHLNEVLTDSAVWRPFHPNRYTWIPVDWKP